MTQNPAEAEASEWLSAPTLSVAGVTLTALGAEHAAGLHAGHDPETVEFLALGGPDENSVAGWERYVRSLNARPARVNWAVLWPSSPGSVQPGAVVGRVSYSEVRPEHRRVEIGTMLLPAARGQGVNAATKLLLMTRAFEVLGSGRVEFKVDARNGRSLRALHKLGAVEEGTLRRFQVLPGGQARDSVVFSVLAEEWPAVKASLLGTLNLTEP